MKLYCEKCKKVFEVSKDNSGDKTPCPKCNEMIAVPESNVAPGVVLGDFLIEKLIACGGMGEVYLARQLSLDRNVALKVLQSKHTDDQDYVESLYREARAAARINHPNVVQAYAIGEDDGVFYFAMEYIRGNTFKSILKEKGGKLEFEQAAKVVRDVARALSAAWKEQKLVHQDIKPDNIMLDANGFAKLADLGLAKSAAFQESDAEVEEVLGTPQYISPEQLTGVPTDIRSDIYSLGATFYQFVTGRYAYVADSLDKLPQMHVDGNLEPPKSVNPELPDELNAIIVKMMARYPENRYQSADELLKDLEKYLAKAKSAPANDKGKPAVPQLKLKVPGKSKAAPAVPAKPAVPGGAKVALPAKPAVPAAPGAGKPAVPPAAPAVPAKPAVPSAPGGAVAPAKPAVPSASGAGKPAVPPAAPEEAINVKPATPQEEKEKDVEKVKAEKTPLPIGKYLKWGSIGVGSLLVLGIAFIVVVFILGKKDRLPEFLKPLNEYMNAEVAKAKNKAIELSKPQEIAVETARGPVSRPEYLDKAAELVKFRRNNPEQREEFLKQVDEAYEMLENPVTDEEKQAFANLLQSFAPADEHFRCAAARNKLRQEFMERIFKRTAEREAAEAARKEQEMLKIRQAQEAERRNRELRERNKLEQAAQAKRIKEFKAQCAVLNSKLAVAMIDASVSGDRTALDAVKTEVAEFIKLTIVKTNEEKNEIAQFNKFMPAIERELKNLAAYRKELAKVNENDNVYVTLNRRGMVVAKIVPCEITVVPHGSGREQKTLIRNFTEAVRARFCRRIKSKYPKLNNLDFFISLFDKHVDAMALKDKPAKGFWKDYWRHFVKDFEKK